MNVTIYSRKEIEELLQVDFPQNVAVISFYDPAIKCIDKDYSHVDYSQKCERVFFSEIDDLDITSLSEKGLTYDTYFPEAYKLAKFIYEAYADDLDIICQCEYGQSRSAGCAAAILEHFDKDGISIFADYKRYLNQVVYHKVFDALADFKLYITKLYEYVFKESTAGKKYDIKRFIKLFSRFSAYEKSIIEQRVRYNKSYMEISEELQINAGRIEQIESRVIRKLIHSFKGGKNIRDFMDD